MPFDHRTIFQFQNLVYAKDKIAYIDIDKLLNQSIAGKLITKKIENKYKLFLISFFIFLILFKKYIFIHFFGTMYFGWEGYEFLPISALLSYEILERLPFLLFQVLFHLSQLNYFHSYNFHS